MVQGIPMGTAILPAAVLMILLVIRAVLVIVVLSAIQVILVLLRNAIILTAALAPHIMITLMFLIRAVLAASAVIIPALHIRRILMMQDAFPMSATQILIAIGWILLIVVGILFFMLRVSA